jgi:hypothetical protein
MNRYFRHGWVFGLAIVALWASIARAASDGVSDSASGPIAIFVFHFNGPSAGRYSITHASDNGGLTIDAYRFQVVGQSSHVRITLARADQNCGSFRASISPDRIVLSGVDSRPIHLVRITDKELAADTAALSQQASNMGKAGAREILSHKSGALWLTCK